MKEKIQTIVTFVIATIVLLPCVLIFNENESLLPNLVGIVYIGGLIAFCKYTKLGQWCAKKLEDVTNKL